MERKREAKKKSDGVDLDDLRVASVERFDEMKRHVQRPLERRRVVEADDIARELVQLDHRPFEIHVIHCIAEMERVLHRSQHVECCWMLLLQIGSDLETVDERVLSACRFVDQTVEKLEARRCLIIEQIHVRTEMLLFVVEIEKIKRERRERKDT